MVSKSQLTEEQRVFMFRNAIHYEASDLPVGTKISCNMETDTCPVVSAGHPKHEYTTGYAQKQILEQFGFVKPGITVIPDTAYEIVVSMSPANALIRQIDHPEKAYDQNKHKH